MRTLRQRIHSVQARLRAALDDGEAADLLDEDETVQLPCKKLGSASVEDALVRSHGQFCLGFRYSWRRRERAL